MTAKPRICPHCKRESRTGEARVIDSQGRAWHWKCAMVALGKLRPRMEHVEHRR